MRLSRTINPASHPPPRTNATHRTLYALDANYAVDYAYDSAGRFVAVTSSVMSVSSVADYSYLPGSDMLSGYEIGNLAVAKTFEPNRDLITTVSNVYNGTAVSSFAYQNDALGRRTERKDYANGVASSNTFDYNMQR